MVPCDWTLDRLHLVLQAAFGWTDSHLHEFRIGGLRYGDPFLLDDGFGGPRIFDHTEVRLQDFVGRDAGFTYAYDFGDDWQHLIQIEEWLALDPAPRHARCLEGAWARPPEAVGGPRGYADFLGIIRDHGARGPSLHAAMGGRAFRSGMVRSRPDQQGSAQCAARERTEGLAARISPTPDRRITWSG